MTNPEKPLLPSPHFDTLSDYEEWASRYWIHEPGTIEAQKHAREKLNEETQELIDAIASGTPEEIISEAGDDLWTAAANGSNIGMKMSECLGSAFPGYFSPENPVTTQEIDSLAAMLFHDISTQDVEEYLKDCERALGKNAKQWFVLGDTVNEPKRTFADALISLKKLDAANALVNITLLISFIAQRYAGKDLASVLEANYQKIEQRVQTGVAVTQAPHHQAQK